MCSMFGWGSSVWSASSYYWWIPVVFCHIGGVLGTMIHVVLVEWTWDGCVGGDTDKDRAEEDKEDAKLKLQNV